MKRESRQPSAFSDGKYMMQIVVFNFSDQEKLVTNKSFNNVNRINFFRQITISLIFLENPKNLFSSLIYLINNCPNYWYDLSSETNIQMWQKMCLFFLFFFKIVQCASAAAAPVTQLLLRITMDLTQSETTS